LEERPGSDGIASVEILSLSLFGNNLFEVGHVVYGFVLPEPATFFALAWGMLTLATARAASRRVCTGFHRKRRAHRRGSVLIRAIAGFLVVRKLFPRQNPAQRRAPIGA
jgi:hypothetical protein